MATAPQAAMEVPQKAGANPFADPNTMAVYDQMRQTVSPKEFGDEILAGASQVDPQEVAKFKAELNQLDVPMEVLDMLNTMVDEILANPDNYEQVKQKYAAMGVTEDLLPAQFDSHFFSALNMAVDQMIGEPAGAQAFARGGIAELTPISKAIANYGRNGDTMLAHITPAEARMLRRRGGAGTTNPNTGLKEYFSLGKLFKGIGNAIKSFASSTVGRIVTTVALGFFLGPAAASFMGVTSAAGVAAVSGFVGSAGSTLLGGGNLKDALKAGAMGGLTAGAIGGVTQGFDTAYAGPTTVGGQVDKFTNMFGGPTADVTTNTARDATRPAIDASGNVKGLAPTDAPVVKGYYPPASTGFPQPGTIGYEPPVNTSFGNQLNVPNPDFAPVSGAGSGAPGTSMFGSNPNVQFDTNTLPAFNTAAPVTTTPTGEASYFDKAKTFVNESISPSGIQEQATPKALQDASNAVAAAEKTLPASIQGEARSAMLKSTYDKAFKAAMPGFLSTYGPATALGIGAIGAFGGFTPGKLPISPYQNMLTGGPGSARDLMSKNPSRYYVQNLPGVNYYGGSVIKPTGMAQGGLADLAKMGRDGDTMLAHINPAEAQMLKHMGGRGTINPKTGLPEFAFRDDDFFNASQDYGGGYDGVYDFGGISNDFFGKDFFDYNREGATPDGVYIDTTLPDQGEIVTIDDRPVVDPPYVPPVIPDPVIPDPEIPDPEIPDPVIPDPVIPDPVIPDPEIPEITITDDRPPRPPPEPPIVLPPVVPRLPPIKPTCPAPEMRILLANGKQKPAGELQVNDVVKTQHETTLAWGEHPVTHVSLVPDASRIKFTLDSGEFVCSLDHKFFKAANDWVTAKDVVLGDMLSGQTVRNIEQAATGDVVRITIDEAHTYICEGLLSHNKTPVPPVVLPPVLPPVAVTPPYVPPVVVEPPYVPPTVTPIVVRAPGTASTDPRVAGVPGGEYLSTRNTPTFPTGPLSRTMSPVEKKSMNMGGIATLGSGGYPRKTGQINGPGTATSDSIPAMLSDGEFVMTEKAVRGAGKGNRRAGAKKMYALMHQLEKNAARG